MNDQPSLSESKSKVNVGNGLFQKQQKPLIISITSGKGGVGKTLTTVNLALAARRMGRSVLIFDGDMGLANVDVVLGLQARYNIIDVLNGKTELKDIILDGPLGIRIIPSASGVSSLTQLSYVQKQQILGEIELLDETPEVILIDTGAGIANNVLHLNKVANKILVVTTPEPHAMTDAYAIIKVLNETFGIMNFDLMVNLVRSAEEGAYIANRIVDVAKRFLGVKVDFVGSVPTDPQIRKYVMLRKAACEQTVYTVAGQAWNQIAWQILNVEVEEHEGLNNLQDMWTNLVTMPEIERKDGI